MINPTSAAIAAGIVLILLGAQGLRADPMRCSGEQKTCNATCAKIARATLANCMEGCHVAQQICMHTGCWSNGTAKYCGLMKQ
jgi:hypothetical protein